MHEMAYVRNVVDVVNEYANRDDVAEVVAVHLTIGEGRDIVIDYFQGLFQFLARGTKAEHAEMVIRRTPFAVSCNRCATVFPLNVFDESSWKCPACGAVRDYRMHSGMEFRIDRIEVKGTGTTGAGTGTGEPKGGLEAEPGTHAPEGEMLEREEHASADAAEPEAVAAGPKVPTAVEV